MVFSVYLCGIFVIIGLYFDVIYVVFWLSFGGFLQYFGEKYILDLAEKDSKRANNEQILHQK